MATPATRAASFARPELHSDILELLSDITESFPLRGLPAATPRLGWQVGLVLDASVRAAIGLGHAPLRAPDNGVGIPPARP